MDFAARSWGSADRMGGTRILGAGPRTGWVARRDAGWSRTGWVTRGSGLGARETGWVVCKSELDRASSVPRKEITLDLCSLTTKLHIYVCIYS